MSDSPPPLSSHDLERLFATLDGAMRVARRSDFYLWAQGALQSFLPHETLICLRGEVQGGQRVELFSRALLGAEAEARLSGRSGHLPAELLADWICHGRRPRAHPAADSPAAHGHMLVHGFDAGQGACLFVFIGMPTAPGARECYLAELLLPQLHSALLRLGKAASPALLQLSARQRQVLIGVRHGKTNAQIALELGLSPLTVKNHVQQMLRKLQVSNRSQAAGLVAVLAEA